MTERTLIKTLKDLREKHRYEKETLFKHTLVRCEYNQSLAARTLGMDRGAFVRDYKKYCGVARMPRPERKHHD